MADPDLRYTPYLNLVYPAQNLDPWDAKYVEQMVEIDRQMMHMQQKASMGRKVADESISWTSPSLTITTMEILVPKWGGKLIVPPGVYTINTGDYLSVFPPDSKWDSDISLVGTGIGPGPATAAEAFAIFYNDGLNLHHLLPELRTAK